MERQRCGDASRWRGEWDRIMEVNGLSREEKKMVVGGEDRGIQ